MNDNEEYMLLECFGVFWNMLEVETMNWSISSFDIDSPTMNWNELNWNEMPIEVVNKFCTMSIYIVVYSCIIQKSIR